MKIYVPMALAVLIVVSAWGRAVVPAALPPAVHADTETVTNVPFATALDVAGRRALPWARGRGRRHVCVRGRGRRPRRPAYTRAFPMAFALARRAGDVAPYHGRAVGAGAMCAYVVGADVPGGPRTRGRFRRRLRWRGAPGRRGYFVTARRDALLHGLRFALDTRVGIR